MSRLVRTLAWVLVGSLAVSPLAAAVYTVTLKNGNVFETRYQPEDASWDKGKIVLLDEMGNLIALAKDDVQEVVSDVESKGYGSVIDNTTMYLGWAPNEGEEAPAGGGVAAAAAQATGQQQPDLTYNQFVEPDQTQGMPANWVGYPVNMNNQPNAPGNPALGGAVPMAPMAPSGDQGK
jgi:hypothetical protein